MPTVNLGRVKMKWRGEWAGSTAYAKDDIVRHGTDTYVATTAHTSHATTFSNDSANWDTMAQGADIPSQSGNAGKALVTDGSNISWGDAGKIYDVYYNAFTNTQVITGSNYTFYDITGLSRTITPQSSSSKFLIMGRVSTGMNGNHSYIALNCGGPFVHIADSAETRLRTTSTHSAKATWDMADQVFTYLWAPNTTNAITIKIQGAFESSALYINRSERDGNYIYDSRATSEMTIFELRS